MITLVTGATGKTGAYTVPLLVARGHEVRAFVHKQLPPNHLQSPTTRHTPDHLSIMTDQ